MAKENPMAIPGGGSGAAKGPRFTDYALRRATNGLTKAETKAEAKWRAKNDPLEYKHEQAMKKAAAAAKKTAAAKKATPVKKAKSKKAK
jgi:hypothetical protein